PILDEYLGLADRLQDHVADTSLLVWEAIRDGKHVIFEGAQGTLLDIDHGTYPFVTSSSSTAGGATVGTGVPPTALDGVIGILKAYTSRVGEGPFPTELLDEQGEFIRERGNEFGTTTGRPRRCGWLDLVAAGYSRRVNGVSSIALTKLDVLDTLEEIPVCVAYRIDGEETRRFPADLSRLARAEPILETRPGWGTDTVGVTEFADLPERAQSYVRFIEHELRAPVSIVSTGPRREETVVRRDDTLRRLTSDRL
ncbi:MAG: adenylosuccinate synthetase, partial [Thermoanaerobaculia bacterium]|nr:adenylosuccinate synthetase [Thermoanaerobaculia bacterium]